MDTRGFTGWKLTVIFLCLVVAFLLIGEYQRGRFQLATHTGGLVYRLDTRTGEVRLFTPMRDGQTAPTLHLVEFGK